MKYIKTISDPRTDIAWLLRLPDKMQPIVGSTNLDRLKEIAKAADINLSREDGSVKSYAQK